MKAISDKIIKSEHVAWRDFKFLQPNNFKELSKESYQKLKNSIVKNSFVESFKCWQNGEALYCLDGFHRCKVLDILDSDGYDVPDKFRADFIDCKDKKEAKKMVLIYSSIYAKTQEEGLYEFVQDLNWDELTEVIDIPNIDLELFKEGYIQGFEPAGIDEQGKLDEKVKVKCPECGHEF